MRLDVFCADPRGLTRELLDLSLLRNLVLNSIQLDPPDRVCLDFSPLSVEKLQQLVGEIRRLSGVNDVHILSVIPFAREQRALRTLLELMPEPAFSIDMKGNLELANSAAQKLFNFNRDTIGHQTIAELIDGYNFNHWLDNGNVVPCSARVMIQHHQFLMEIAPISLEDQQKNATTGAWVMLKPALRTDCQLATLAVGGNDAFADIVGVSPQMRHVLDQARKLAVLDVPLLIVGETGTGKDVLARACHLHSPRGKQPFLALNCASLPDDVVESELFGHAPGAYPNALEGKKGFFEQANGGSVLLDEIGEMSPRMQTKLVRFLNDGTFRRVGEEDEVHVDVRVICATQKNLIALVQRGEFREDLYYRLNVLTINIPPLCEHPQDIMPLTELFVARFANEQGIAKPKLAANLGSVLTTYHWPGNVRQLKNVIYRALAQMEGNELSSQHIELPALAAEAAFHDDVLVGSLDEICKRFERSILTRLYQTYPSTRKLAKRLGVSHTAIANKLREYGLNKSAFSDGNEK